MCDNRRTGNGSGCMKARTRLTIHFYITSPEVTPQMDIRAVVQRILDEIQFRYDVFPRLLYQPLPWLGLNSARRGVGTKQRWKAMEAALATHSIRSAMDIGCNVGYFCFALSLKGIPTLGIELNDQFYRTALYASRRLKTSNVGLCNMEVGAQTVHLLPNTDLG